MNFAKSLILAAALALSGASQAAVLVGSTGSNTVTDYSSAGIAAFNLDLEDFSGTRLVFRVEDGDLLGPLSLNAIVANLSGDALSRFNFGLEGITFARAGSVTPTFGSLGSVNGGADAVSIGFNTPEWAEFHFGNPLAESGATDWLLNTAGLRAGDTFAITAEVPEPSSMALVALCMSGLLAMRRKQRG